MIVNGIDISRYDGIWDADKAKLAGCEFVFIKASQSNYSDPMFSINRVKAKAAGILRGFYHYFDWLNISTVTGKKQAEYLLSLIGNDPPELPLIIDCEYQQIRNNSGVLEIITLPSNAIHHIQDFASEIINAGLRVGIYTGVGFWDASHTDPFWKDPYWKQLPLWVANWEVNVPRIPAPWNTLPVGQQYKFWQWRCSRNKADCLKYGTSGNEIDLNYFNGTLEELKVFGGNATPPIIIPPIVIPPIVISHPAICPTCGQVWPSSDSPNYQVRVGYRPNVHYPGQSGPIVGVLMAGAKLLIKSYDAIPLYAYFEPTPAFTHGGYVYKSYLEKLA